MTHQQSLSLPSWFVAQIKGAAPGRSFNSICREALEAWLIAETARNPQQGVRLVDLFAEPPQVDARAVAEALATLAGTPASAERHEEPRTYILTFTTEDLVEPWNERVTEYNVAYLEEGGTPLRTWGELDPDERQEIVALVIKELEFVTESSTAEAIYSVVGNVAVSYATGTPL